MKEDRFGESVEMYLKTIAKLAGKSKPVPVTNVAEQLKISTVSASEMIHRLQDRDLLNHIPYKGVRLTAKGRRQANVVIRSHRLWERFLTDELGLPWELVHEFACRLEHTTETEITEALADYLGQPAICPHGNPIPSPEGEMPLETGIPLTDLGVGESGVIARIHPEGENKPLCSYLAERGIKPGVRIKVEEIAPLDGPIFVIVKGASHVLDRTIAIHILVEVGERV
jgi:DtxR family Mn-dependent transcriptional regulator